MVVAMPNIKNVLTNKFNKDGQDLAIHNRFLRMKYIIEIFMCLFLICSCDNHDVEFNEKEQTFYIYNLLHFSIEPLDSFSKSYTYDFFCGQREHVERWILFVLKKNIKEI